MFYGKSRGQSKKYKRLLKNIDKIKAYEDKAEIEEWGFEHFHVPCRVWLDMPRTSSKIKTEFCKAWIRKTEEILKAKPEEFEFCKVVCCLCIPHLRNSQIIVFYTRKYYESFWERHCGYQEWEDLPEGQSLMKERNIVTDLKETGFKETLTDEDYTAIQRLWFYGEVND